MNDDAQYGESLDMCAASGDEEAADVHEDNHMEREEDQDDDGTGDDDGLEKDDEGQGDVDEGDAEVSDHDANSGYACAVDDSTGSARIRARRCDAKKTTIRQAPRGNGQGGRGREPQSGKGVKQTCAKARPAGVTEHFHASLQKKMCLGCKKSPPDQHSDDGDLAHNNQHLLTI